MLEINEKEVIEVILNFIEEYTEKAGINRVVIGLSGGVDSSVVAKLATMALGKENVYSLFLPDGSTPLEDFEHSRLLAKILGIYYKVIDISPLLSPIINVCDKMDEIVLGNIKARMRMILLYQFANSRKALVCGTLNKTELLVGYFTKYGDGASDFLPIGDLYKTQVYKIAEYLEIPEEIIKKPPTAGLWKGQTDEDELGITYDKLDKILYCIERGFDIDKIANMANVEVKEVNRIYEMVNRTEHKRRLPPIAKIGFRTVGVDWRFPLKL